MPAPSHPADSAPPPPLGRWAPWLIVAASAAAIFFELGRADIAIIYEGQRSVPGIEMLQTGDFVVPRINGDVYIVKPPLLYWTLAGLYRATGMINEFIARVPNALSGVLLVLAVYLCARRALGERAGLWSAVVMAATPMLLHRSRVADLDMPLAFTTFLAIMWMWTALEVETRRWLRVGAAGLAFGAAILLKGPVAALFLVPAWAVHAIAFGSEPEKTARRGLLATAAFFIADWLINLVHAITPPDAPEFVHRILIPPYGLMATAALWLWFAWRYAPPDRLRRIGVLAAVTGLGVLVAAPWFILAVQALGWDYWKSLLHDQAVDRTYVATDLNSGSHFFYLIGYLSNAAPWSLLTPLLFLPRVRAIASASPAWSASALTAAVTLAIFSLIAGKEADYVLSAYPFIAITFGGVLVGLTKDRYVRTWSAILVPVLVVGSIGVAIYAMVENRANTTLVIEQWAAVVLALATAWKLRHPAHRTVGVAVLTLIGVTQGLVMQSHYYQGLESPRELALVVRALHEKGERVEAAAVRAPVAFYVRTLIPVDDDLRHVAETLHGPTPYYYFCRRRHLEELRAAAGPDGFQVLGGPYAKEHYVLIGNRPLPEGIGAGLYVGPTDEEKP